MFSYYTTPGNGGDWGTALLITTPKVKRLLRSNWLDFWRLFCPSVGLRLEKPRVRFTEVTDRDDGRVSSGIFGHLGRCSGPFPGKLHPFRSSSKTFGRKITPLPHFQAVPLTVRTPLGLWTHCSLLSPLYCFWALSAHHSWQGEVSCLIPYLPQFGI